MRLLSFYFKRGAWPVFLAVIGGVISGLSTALLISVIERWISGRSEIDFTTAAVFLTLCLMRLASGLLTHFVLIHLSQCAVRDLRVSLCERLIAAPLRLVERLGRGRLMGTLTEDIQQVAQVIVNVPYFMINIVVLLACLGYLGVIHPLMSLATLAAVTLGALSYFLPVVIANRKLGASRNKEDELFEQLTTAVDGVRELKQSSSLRAVFIDEKLRPCADAVRRGYASGIRLYATAANWNRTLFFVYIAALLLLANQLQWGTPITLAGVVVVILYMMAPIEAVCNALPHLARANVALRKIDALGLDLSALPSDTGCNEGASAQLDRPSSIALDGVTFAYDLKGDDQPGFAVGPVSLSLQAGRVYFLIGRNGSGKTTLMKLISGQYSCDTGTLLQNGAMVGEDQRDAYRDQIAAIWADGYVFSWQHAKTDQGIHRDSEMVEALGLDGVVDLAQPSIDTNRFSTGQLKRIAMLRALLDDKPIYLFDEWAASQDPEYRHLFYTEMLSKLAVQNKIVFVISHDQQYFSHADHILHIRDGLIEEVSASQFDFTDLLRGGRD